MATFLRRNLYPLVITFALLSLCSNISAPYVLKLRKAKPETPIILVEDSHYLDKSPTEDGKLVRNIYHNLLSAGIKNIYFLSNKGMLGSDGEGTVDTVHPNDLGMLRQAAVFTDFIARLINKGNI